VGRPLDLSDLIRRSCNVAENKAPERDLETLALFIEESQEGLQRVEKLLLEAERGDLAPDAVATIFRDIHTIKGTSSFLALGKILALSHAAESLLARLRDQSLGQKPEHFALLLSVGDALRKLVESVKDSGDEGELPIAPLVEQLQAQLRGGASPSIHAVPPDPPVRPAEAKMHPQPAMLGEILVQKNLITQEQLEEGLREQAEAQRAARPEGDSTIRVNVAVLDQLVNLIGELVLSRNQVVQLVKVSRDATGAAQGACQRLNVVTSDLQETIMKTRMQPIARVFEKIPRMVRDLCNSTGKLVTTQIEGTSTEIDRAVVDAVRDPVMHIIRNAIDHGIESPEQRRAGGKSASGRLSVRASHQGGQVTLEIEDDGRGMDPKALRIHAVRKGILSADAANRLDDREALELIFRPGFSTAAAVTDISGRGVGMDVVRTHVERAGGQVELDSLVGRGTTIRLKMPLTMAIMPALLLRSGKQRFAIPQVNLLELIHLDDAQARARIEHVRGAFIYRLRGALLPLVRLNEVLGIVAPAEAVDGSANIVVVAVGARRYGLVVDQIDDTEEIVVKPLHGALKRLACYSGATVLGNGDVALILEPGGVAARAGIDLNTQQKAEEIVVPAPEGRPAQPFVIFRAGDGAQCAVPLAVVARLEQIKASSIETVAGSEVVQYRGTIMPIIRLEGLLPIGKARVDPDDQQMLLVFDFGQQVGLAVDQIIDIVDVDEAPEEPDSLPVPLPFTLGQAVALGKATLLIDVYPLVRNLAPQFVRERRRQGPRPRVMLVDDSPAMRAAVGGYLRARGYDVVEAADGDHALRDLRAPDALRVDAVVTDVEMPGLDGLGLVSALRGERPKLPVVAWTFHDDAAIGERAIKAGARACVNKLEREQLMVALQDLGIGRRPGETAGTERAA
jgi:two-component system chemotaxis sensor kinase CheA